jgi:L-iditol 2-dehydrogenase
VVMPQNGCGRCDLCLAGEHIRCQSPVDPYAINGKKLGRATYAQYCLQQDWLLYPAPKELSIEHASMACCGLGPTFTAMQMMEVNGLDTVLISGLGPVGLGGIINARLRGARVIGIEGNPYRAALAKELGAETVLDPAAPDLQQQVKSLTGGKGADKSIECSSTEAAPATLANLTRINGQLTSVGWGGPIDMKTVVSRGLTVRGAWHWNHLRDGEAMRRTLIAAQPYLDTLITHRFPMSKVKEAWEVQATGMCGKVLLDPWG